MYKQPFVVVLRGDYVLPITGAFSQFSVLLNHHQASCETEPEHFR